MDEEVDPDNENVNSVLAQESSELLRIISGQTPVVIMKLCEMMPSEGRWDMVLGPGSSSATHNIEAMLNYYIMAKAADCCNFLQSVCILCENIPMHLESRLMSVAGNANNDCENSSPSVTDGKTSSPLSEKQLIKRPRIGNHWERYIAAVMRLLQRRWERLSERLVRDVQLERVWVSLRTPNRGRDRPDQTPGSAEKGGRTPEPDGDYGFMESRVTLETFLNGCAGKVTILVGPAGSGKTLLMSCLGQQWAQRLAPIPSSHLFVLLEFRHLNLLSCPLSLSELLFRHYLPLKGCNEANRAIVDYLISNPEQSCWVLDGYDEFHSKITKQELHGEPLDADKSLPVSDLVSGLLNRQLLPGCTVVVTCRARNVSDLEGLSDKVGHLLGWDRHEIKEYVDNFFGLKGHSSHKAIGPQAADLLLSSRHLLAMSSLPGLCNTCCICLEYLLLEAREPSKREIHRESGTEARRNAESNEEKELHIPGGGRGEEGRRGESYGPRGDQRRGNDDILTDGTNGRAQPTPTEAQIPPTLTQIYLTVICAFLSRDPDATESNEGSNATSIPQSVVCTLGRYRSELCELSQLAWRGVEESRILFTKEDISPEVLDFSIRTGLFSQVELRREDGGLVNSYCFNHLTLQEFMAALRIMTSADVSDTQLKKRFSLKTRWTTKTDQRTVFTDSLHQYVCGLASPCCTEALVEVARTSGGSGGQSWVQKRQNLVLKLLKNFCQSNTLTGPKILDLCHCVQESQDHQLAKQAVDGRSTLELRNIRLLPTDIDALAFVVSSAGDNGIGLDFGACSMELECFDVLPRCRYIHSLSFRSRKYGDKFAEKLSSILPNFTTLRKLEFCCASLTVTGAASLVSALQDCPDITEINLSDNNLKDEGIKHVADIFTKPLRLISVKLGRNNSSLEAVDYLIGKMSSCSNFQNFNADGMKELTVTFSQTSDLNSHKTKSEPTISLLNQKWCKTKMQKLANSLARCPALSVLDISGGHLDVETLRMLTKFVPKFKVTKKIIANDCCSSVEGLVVLTALLSDCPAVVELSIRLQSPVQVSIVFSGGREKAANEKSKILCLSCCDLLPAHLEKVWRSLGASSDLTLLDLSSNCLGKKGLKKLLEVLPRLGSIQEVNASNNGIGREGVALLAGALCSHNNLTQIHISGGDREQVILKFCPDKRKDKQRLKMLRINNSSILPSNVTTLCRQLAYCRSHLELDLSHSSLTDKAIENLLKCLPKMTSLQRLNVSHSIISTSGAVMLVRCLNVSQRVTSVELRPQSESFICFGTVKAEEASCRLTHCSLKGDELERLLKILQRCPHLSNLNLSSNQLGDEGVKRFLDSLQTLKITSYVNLSGNGLTQEGVLDVVSALCNCNHVSGGEVSLGAEQKCLIWFTQCEGCVKTLSIRESCLEHNHLIRLAEIVSICPSLIKLEFKNNMLDSDWIADFVKLLNSSQRGVSVSIEEYWIRSEDAVSLLCRCLELGSNIHTIRVNNTTLHLSLMKSTELSEDSADLNPSMATKKISLVDCAVEGHHLASMESVITKCSSLTELDLSHNSLGAEGAEFLCSVLPLLPNLTSLSIDSKETCVTVVEKLSEALLQAKAIQCLNLSGHVISDSAAHVMTRILPTLRSLNLSHCEWSAAGGLQLLEALGESVRLEGLCLDSVQLNEESRVCLAHALRNIKSIRSLKLNKTATATGPSKENEVLQLLAATEGLTLMEEIELNGWRMADRGIEQLSGFLPAWTELRKISLSKNLISDQSGDQLLEALNRCSHLEELHLSSNSLGDLTAARMALVLPSLTHITVLDIAENKIGEEGLVNLAKAVTCLKNLTKLQLTSVGTSELCDVAASLAHCPLIQDVGLGWNNCGDKVAEELARVMPLCQKLTRIDLESNTVSVFGAEALVRALQLCPALQLIRLWRNKVPISVAKRLSQRDRRLNFSST
ncbi:protein NLRC5 isoform X1 [Gymnodraco acuticeps]|uniref:Protein NLRC5 isoform X1 n=1 Tax=Gymnodraco acuticeps TaxID=8218 RepID=A0A6P8TD18_GYMAC|nr:protein NLRC5 isoform X1 [Gymnodraco acuticeps]